MRGVTTCTGLPPWISHSVGMQWQEAIGRRFGRWLVIADAGRTAYRKRVVRVRCRCGFETETLLHNLISARSTQCRSCSKKGKPSNRKTHGHATKKPAEYRIWRGMWQRCTNKRCKDYKNYGALGIAVCARWRGPDGYTNFLSDMGKRPSRRHSLDRKDPWGDYEPSNCRWATPRQQTLNQRHRVNSREDFLAVSGYKRKDS